jgi:hypothetical protein
VSAYGMTDKVSIILHHLLEAFFAFLESRAESISMRLSPLLDDESEQWA